MELNSREQGVARIANDRTYCVMWAIEAEGGAFLCECNRSSCSERITMTPSEYVRLRDRHEGIYASGHDLPQAS
jgi:hypothetical protein